jgi:glucosyl-3-phosphoglycerate synthase
MDTVPFVDEIVVLDDRSHDHTAQVAADEGAVVVPVDEVVHPFAPGRGKGNVLWSSLLASSGDIVVWCDADLTSFTADWIVRLSYPLLIDPTVQLVKAFYERPTDAAGWGGGRNTELVARPLLSMLYPKLAAVYQPLAGEMAGRRTALEQLNFVQGWGVEVSMLVETLERFGPSAIAQVDLGIRKHRHRPLDDLSVQAAEIMLTLLQRSGRALPGELREQLERANGELIALNVASRPPVASLRRP